MAVAQTNTVLIYDAYARNSSPVGQITQGLSIPYNVAVDAQGDVFVSNLGGANVTGYRPGTTTPFVTYSQGLLSPSGIVAGNDGSLYVASYVGAGQSAPGFVTLFPPNSQTPSFVVKSKRFHQVQALALDAKNNLYIAYTSGKATVDDVQAGIVELPAGSQKLKATGILVNHFQAGGLTIDRAGNFIFSMSNTGNGTAAIEIFPPGQTSPSKIIGPPTLLNYPAQVTLNQAENRIIVGSAGSAAYVYNYATWTLVNTFATGGGPVIGVGITPKAPF